MKTHAQFCKDLDASRGAVLAVAAYLQLKGRDVTLPAHRVAPNREERYAFQDNGDLMVAKPHQVKETSYEFTSNTDFPFDPIIVDEEYKVKRQLNNPPAGYWIVNKDKSAALFIPWETKPKWTTFTSYDKKQGRECTFLRCPLSLTHYIQLC